MSNGTVLDCNGVPPAQRRALWEQGLQRLLGCRVHCEPLDLDGPLQATLEKHDLAGLSLLSIRGGAQRARLQPPSGFRGTVVMMPLSGQGRVDTQPPLPLRADHAYLLDPQQPWLLHLAQSFEHRVLMLPSERADHARARLAGRAQAVLPLRGVGDVFRRLLNASFTQAPLLSNGARQTLARSLVDLLNATIADADPPPQPTAAHTRLAAFHRREVREYALSHLQDPDLDVQSIARAARLSVRYLHQLFSADGTSLMRWIWSQRLARCRLDLEGSAGVGVQISEVAYAWGFRDPNHFSRAFRQAYGLSPSAVAQGARGIRPDPGVAATARSG